MDAFEHIERLESAMGELRHGLQLERAARLTDVAELQVQVDALRAELRRLAESHAHALETS